MPKRKRPRPSPEEVTKRLQDLYDRLEKAGEILPDGEQRFNLFLEKVVEPVKSKRKK